MSEIGSWFASDLVFRSFMGGAVGLIISVIFQTQSEIRSMREEMRQMRLEIINSNKPGY